MAEAPKPRLKLYHASPSRSSVTLWMLEELGEPYEIELLSLKNGDQRKPEYLAVNPMGKVPTLDDAGSIVSEVSAICCHLADAYPKAGLAPAVHDKLRGPYLKWLFYVPSCVEPAVLDKAMNRPPPPRSTAGSDRRPEARRASRPEHQVEVERPVGLVGRSGQLRPVHEVRRDLEQEPRRHRRLAHPPRRPPPGM